MMRSLRLGIALLVASGLASLAGCDAPEPGAPGPPAPEFRLEELRGGELSLEDFRGKTLILDFWATWCVPCLAQIPILNAYAEAHAEEVAVVGVYHPKPARDVTDDEVRAAASELGFTGPLLVDADWSVLESFWLNTGSRRATSVSFLVDDAGLVRWVHPGPELHPSDDPEHAQCQRDYEDLERAVRFLLESGA